MDLHATRVTHSQRFSRLYIYIMSLAGNTWNAGVAIRTASFRFLSSPSHDSGIKTPKREAGYQLHFVTWWILWTRLHAWVWSSQNALQPRLGMPVLTLQTDPRTNELLSVNIQCLSWFHVFRSTISKVKTANALAFTQVAMETVSTSCVT